MTQQPESNPPLDKPCAYAEADDTLDRLVETHERTVADLERVLDVEAGLAEIINRSNDNEEK